jgi:dipeptidase E
MGKLLLTSTGLSSENVVKKLQSFLTDLANQDIAIITTAAKGKEQNKYSQLAKKQLEDMGFLKIDFIDLESESSRNLSSYKIIYVCGGNTFKLLKFAREANFKDSIENLLKRDGIYIGVSAGSIIVGPSIDIANEVDPDPNDIGLSDLVGLNLTDVIILPHYSPEMENETLNFEKKYGVTVDRINNSQAILIDNGQKIVV